MIPRVAKAGRSFKGAALYYLHDKQAMTDDRVAFVETTNLPTNNPAMAVAHMIDTTTHADQLKRAAGIRSGNHTQKPVYCYSLAWHTSENPSHAEQMEAAKATLEKLGLSDRQAIIIGHNDTDHTHVHIMVNRVCPKTGRAANVVKDQLTLSRWAHDYRKARGELHFCPEREKNLQRRNGEFVKDQSMTRQEWQAWKKGQAKEIWDEFRADKAKAQPSRKGQFEALWRQKEERFALRRDEIKQLYKPVWRDVFKRQAKELKDFDASLVGRIKFVLGQPRGKVAGLLGVLVGKQDLRAEFIRKQEAARDEIAKGQNARIADASREITKAWKFDRNELKEMHAQQDQKHYEATKAKSAEVWKDKPVNQSGQDFDETADRRKDTKKRQSFDEKLRRTKGSEAVDAANTDARKRTRRQRNRARKKGDRGFSLD